MTAPSTGKLCGKHLANRAVPHMSQGLAPPLAEPVSTMFVPAVVEPSKRPEPAVVRRTRRRRRATAAAVELEIDGVAVKIARGADAGVIAAVIEALKDPR